MIFSDVFLLFLAIRWDILACNVRRRNKPMPIIQKTAVVPYTPEQMFNLVNDVARYPEFIPWCSGSQVMNVTEDHMVARLDLMQAGFKQSFTTENTLKKPD